MAGERAGDAPIQAHTATRRTRDERGRACLPTGKSDQKILKQKKIKRQKPRNLNSITQLRKNPSDDLP